MCKCFDSATAFIVGRVGIIGEPISGFNAETLMPLGEDQEMSQVEIISDDCSTKEIKPR